MNLSYIDEIPSNTYKIIQEIGSGAFSDVFLAVHLKTNSKVALKISLKNKSENEMKLINREILINKSLDHPFICKYYTDFETDHLKIIVMENIEGISALDYVNQVQGLPYQEAINLFVQLIITIEYLHDEAHITHRDLKLENIMIDKYNHIRLIDFGFSSINTMMSSCCGSIPYCAPEIISRQKYTKAADIWSLGIILYAFIDGNLPFFHPNINTIASMICQNEVQFTQNFTNPDIQDLIQRMLIKNPQQRITIAEIKSHPLLAQQKLLMINYKELFDEILYYSKSLFSSSKSSVFIQIDNSIQTPSLLKEPLSSDETTGTHHHIQSHDLNESARLLDQVILSRKEFALNLNKSIDSALLNSVPQKNISLHNAVSLSGFHLNSRRYNYLKRSAHRYVFKDPSPLIQPKINSPNIIRKRNLDKK